MAEADLTGADAHGVFRLPQYILRIEIGGVNPTPDIKVNALRPPPPSSMAITAWVIW